MSYVPRLVIPLAKPALFLAPMQDVTDLPFLRTIAAFGGADFYVTEYFRVHIHSRLDPYILRSIDENPTGRPMIAQMIGCEPDELVRTARELKKHAVAGIDLNLGCPAPVVYRKNAGGGLLRKPEGLNEILGRLCEACDDVPFTVKTRVGFETEEEFDQLLEVFQKYPIHLLTIHGRTVRERYQTPVHPERVAQAVEALDYPVIANGNVVNRETGKAYLRATKAAGLMIGRGAIRNPWIFSQLRDEFQSIKPTSVKGRMVLDYIDLLYEETAREIPDFIEVKHVQKMKKYLVYIVQGLPGEFEHRIRRAKTKEDFFSICRNYLDHDEIVPDLPPENSRLFCGFSQFLDSQVSP